MIRVCKKGHLTGFRKCMTCGADAVGVLGERSRPMKRFLFVRQSGAPFSWTTYVRRVKTPWAQGCAFRMEFDKLRRRYGCSMGGYFRPAASSQGPANLQDVLTIPSRHSSSDGVGVGIIESLARLFRRRRDAA